MRFHSRNGSVTPTPRPNRSPRLLASPTLNGLQPHSPGQHQSREELGGRDAGASRRREHGIFGGRHVGPPAQQGDRFADRERVGRRRQRVGHSQVGRQRLRLGPDEHAQPVDRRRLSGDERWNGRPCRFEQRDRSIDIELRTSTRGQELLRELGRALLVGDVVARDGEPRLRASDIGVRKHDLGRHRHQGEAAKRSLTREVGARRRNGGATGAEDVHFPTCVHAGIEQVHVGCRGGADLRPAALECGASLRRTASSCPLARAAWREPASPAPSPDGRRGFDRAPARRAMSCARPGTLSTTRRRARVGASAASARSRRQRPASARQA